MHWNEVAFVASRIARFLLGRDLIAKGVAKSRSGAKGGDMEATLARWIAEQIREGRAAWEVSSESVAGLKMTEGVALLKAKLREIIPASFGWWMELDHDVRISVRWMWLGHPAVTLSGSCSDSDVTILLELLRGVDWDEEARRAMESVETAEAELLRQAQERRRLRLANPQAHALALPPVELGSLAPVPFEAKKEALGPKQKPKRRETAAEIDARVKRAEEAAREEKRAKRDRHRQEMEERMEGYLAEEERPRRRDSSARADTPPPPAVETPKSAPAPKPEPEPEPEPASEAQPVESAGGVADAEGEERPEVTGDPETLAREIGCEWFLSRDRYGRRVEETRWIPCADIREVLATVAANPMGTFRQAWSRYCRMKTPEQVWRMTGKAVPSNWHYRAPGAGHRRSSGESSAAAAEPDPARHDPFWFRRN